MIKLVLPVCERDFPLVNLLGHRFIDFADMKERSLLVTAQWADHFGVSDFCKAMQPHFKDVSYYIMEDVPEGGGWPETGNHVFYHTAQYLDKQGNVDPWYFFEPDCFPLYPHWMDAFDAQYEEKGMPYMGTFNATRLRDRRTGQLNVTGKHMVGAGIYPADFFTRCKTVHFLEHQPWDIEIQDEVVPECHDTNLIFHAFRTRRYRIIEGQVIGEDMEKNGPTGGPKHSYGGRPIPAEALVAHGCKDGSLSKIDFAALRAKV